MGALLPTVLRNWWGFFFGSGVTVPVAHMVVDYQNIHLTAHDRFCPEGEPAHLCLIHPLHYALQVLDQRNLIKRLVAEKDGGDFTPAALGTVRSFRGQPSNLHEPASYRRSQAQQSEWTRDRRSIVRYRPLKYYDNGRGVKEKGIDVLVALELVQLAAAAESEDTIVILAAHDTDQEPALELANRLAPGRIETTGWQDEKRLVIPGVQMWHTFLDQNRFERAIDRRPY